MYNAFELQTERLRLIPLNLENLLLLQEDRTRMEENLGLQPSRMAVTETIPGEFAEALDFWISRVREDEENYPWYTNWEIVLKAANHSVGGIGVAIVSHAPEQVLIGYGIDARFQQQGFATESLRALAEWVFSYPDKHSIIAETFKNNAASQQVLVKSGFEKMEEREETYLWTLSRTHHQKPRAMNE